MRFSGTCPSNRLFPQHAESPALTESPYGSLSPCPSPVPHPKAEAGTPGLQKGRCRNGLALLPLPSRERAGVRGRPQFELAGISSWIAKPPERPSRRIFKFHPQTRSGESGLQGANQLAGILLRRFAMGDASAEHLPALEIGRRYPGAARGEDAVHDGADVLFAGGRQGA